MENYTERNSPTIQELAKRAKSVLNVIITDQLPETEEELDRFALPEERAWFKLDFLGKVADNDTIREYLRKTGREIKIINFWVDQKLKWSDFLYFDRLITGHRFRPISVTLIIDPYGLQIKGSKSLENPINTRANFELLLETDPKEAVKTIAELDLRGCLLKIEKAVIENPFHLRGISGGHP